MVFARLRNKKQHTPSALRATPASLAGEFGDVSGRVSTNLDFIWCINIMAQVI